MRILIFSTIGVTALLILALFLGVFRKREEGEPFVEPAISSPAAPPRTNTAERSPAPPPRRPISTPAAKCTSYTTPKANERLRKCHKGNRVKEFQREIGMPENKVDGYWGEETQQWLDDKNERMNRYEYLLG